MSLFGARKTSTFQKAKERAEKMEREEKARSTASVTSSSHIGGLIDKIIGSVSDDGEIASERNDLEQMERDLHRDSEYERLRDEEKKEEVEAGLRYAGIEDDLRRRENSQAT